MILTKLSSPLTPQFGLLLLCLGVLSPLTSPVAEAKPNPEPAPEKRRPPATNGRSAGSRGCSLNSASTQSQAFSLMLPPSGQTKLLAEQPTLGWTLGNRHPVAVIFRLYAVVDHQPLPQIIIEEQLEHIPTDAKRLSYTVQQPLANGSYLWQVELVCDRDRPSSNIALEGQFRKLAAAPQLTTALAAAPTTAAKIKVLWSAGYGYDVYSSTLNQSETAALGDGFTYGITSILLSTDPHQGS